MSNRSHLLSLRPEIPSLDLNAAASPVEQFQNQTLRPILKFQNDLLVGIFQRDIMARKGVFHTLTPTQRSEYIRERVHKDKSLRHLLLGTLIGHFTDAEYHLYLSHEKEIRKRAMDLLIQRLQDQLL